jgi:aryl-alcohol dehydrogenase-like predicted oxidoreductase
VQHLRENLRAAELKLPREELAKLNAIAAEPAFVLSG